MPSSTPLYHDAIKTVASSDDDSPPARSPNLPSANNNGKQIKCNYVLQFVGKALTVGPVLMCSEKSVLMMHNIIGSFLCPFQVCR